MVDIFNQKIFTQIVRLSFVDLRWAQLYVSLVYFVHVLLQLFILELQAYAEKVGHSEY